MKPFNIITLAIVIVGGLNWGIVSWFGEDLVSMLLGPSTLATRLVHLGVGLAALYQILPLWLSLRFDQAGVQADRAV